VFNCLKEHIVLFRFVRKFSEEQARIHAGSEKGNYVYAICSKYKSVYTHVLGYVSSVYVFYYDLATSGYCCSVLGSESGIWLLLLCSGYSHQRSDYCESVLFGGKEFA